MRQKNVTDMIDKITLVQAVSDSNVIEAIRSSLPVATKDKAGLANKNLLDSFNTVSVYLKNGQKANIGKAYGLLVVRNSMLSHVPFIFQCSNYFRKVELIHSIGNEKQGFHFEWSSSADSYDNELYIVCDYQDPDVYCNIRVFFQSN